MTTAIAINASALAATVTVTREGCRPFVQRGEKWFKLAPLAIGSLIEVKPSPKRQDMWSFDRDGESFLVEKSCVAESTAHTAPLVQRPESQNPTIHRSTNQGLYILSGILSWQEALTLTSPSQTQYTVLATQLGVTAGLGFQSRMGYGWYWDISAAGVLANSDAALEASSLGTADIEYQVSNSQLKGFLGQMGLLWRPPGNRVTIGFSVPLLMRDSPWTLPGGGYTLDMSSNKALGLMLDARYESGSFFLAPKFGFIKSASHLIWVIQAGWRL